MTSHSSLAAWLGFLVSTALTARLLARVPFSPARAANGRVSQVVSPEDL